MPAVKTGFGAQPMPGMPAPMGAPMAPMGGGMPMGGLPMPGMPMPGAPMPGAPMGPAPLPGPGVTSTQQASGFNNYVMGAPRRKRFGDFLERSLSYREPVTADSMGLMDVFTGQMAQMVPAPGPQGRGQAPVQPRRMEKGGTVRGYAPGGVVTMEDVYAGRASVMDLYNYVNTGDNTGDDFETRVEKARPPIVTAPPIVPAQSSVPAATTPYQPSTSDATTPYQSSTSGAVGIADDGSQWTASQSSVAQPSIPSEAPIFGPFGSLSILSNSSDVYGGSGGLNMPDRGLGGDLGIGDGLISQMVATSPIGSIMLPERPDEFMVEDFLVAPVYGTLDPQSEQEMANGGMVRGYDNGGEVPPRRTDIRGQDHMLAYITPDEAGILKALGGTGEAGPMGIPSYPEPGYGTGGMGDPAGPAVGGQSSGGQSSGGQSSASASASADASADSAADSVGGNFDAFGNEYGSAVEAAVADAVAEAAATAANVGMGQAGTGGYGASAASAVGDALGLGPSAPSTTSPSQPGTPSSFAPISEISLPADISLVDPVTTSQFAPNSVQSINAPSNMPAATDTAPSLSTSAPSAQTSVTSLSAPNVDTSLGLSTAPSTSVSVSDPIASTGTGTSQMSVNPADIGGIFAEDVAMSQPVAPSMPGGLSSVAPSMDTAPTGIMGVPSAPAPSAPSAPTDVTSNINRGLAEAAAQQTVSNSIDAFGTMNKDAVNSLAEDLGLPAAQVQSMVDNAVTTGVNTSAVQPGSPQEAARGLATQAAQDEVSQSVDTSGKMSSTAVSNIADKYGLSVNEVQDMADQSQSALGITSTAPSSPAQGKTSVSTTDETDPQSRINEDRAQYKGLSSLQSSTTVDVVDAIQSLMEDVSRDVTFADKAKATAQNIVSITTGLVSTTTPEEVANARADRAQDALDAYKDGDTTFGGYFSDDTESPMGEGPDDILLEEDKVTTEAADDTGYTTDESGNIICNNPDYIYDPVSQQCGPIGDSIKLNMPSRPIDMADVLQGITTNQVNIAPISGMQAGGMAGLNSAADKFIRSLAG